MKRYLYITVATFASLCVLAMGACSKRSQESGPEQARGGRVEWNMLLEGSRAAVDADGSGYFEEGDSIVIAARNLSDGALRYFTLHLSERGWEPEIYWDEIGEDVEFTAWHASPAGGLDKAGAAASSEFVHVLASDQTGKGYVASDLMGAKARVLAGNTVRLRFVHSLSRLHVVLESNDGSYTAEQLQKVQIQVYTPGRLTFSLAGGGLNSCSGGQWVTPCSGKDNVWTALVCPQAAEDLPSGSWIRVVMDGTEKTVGVPETVEGKPLAGLEAGKELTYRLNLKKDAALPDEFAGTTRWVYGVKEPSDDQWNYDSTQLSWTEGCGWYDCNKVDPSDISSSGDGLMCWAAAVSNLVHWWLQQNSGTAAVQAYTGPAAVPSDMLHSAVFQLYKDNFPNRGEYPIKAINWFFNGVFQRKIYDSDPVDPAAGFFRGQLGTQTLGAEYSGLDLKRDRFNSVIRQALALQQGVVFVVNLGKAWKTHAVTLWGAGFDDDGLIDMLYMVDNNDGRSDARGTIRTMEVKYLPYGGGQELYPYVANSLGEFTIRIESLCTLSLGREWVK